MEPRRIDLDALLKAHAFMYVERPPLLWELNVDDVPFIRMLGEMIVVGLLHHDVLAELTLNASNVTVGDDGPAGASGDHVAITIKGPRDWEPDVSWAPASTTPFWSPDLDAAIRTASGTTAYLRRLGADEGSITVFIPRWQPGDPPSSPRSSSSSDRSG